MSDVPYDVATFPPGGGVAHTAGDCVAVEVTERDCEGDGVVERVIVAVVDEEAVTDGEAVTVGVLVDDSPGEGGGVEVTVADGVIDAVGVTVGVDEGNTGAAASERHSVLPQLCARPANVDVTVSNVTIQLPTVEAPAATAGTEFVNASVK